MYASPRASTIYIYQYVLLKSINCVYQPLCLSYVNQYVLLKLINYVCISVIYIYIYIYYYIYIYIYQYVLLKSINYVCQSSWISYVDMLIMYAGPCASAMYIDICY